MINNKLKVALFAAILSVVGISVAYAALSTTLTVTVNKVTQNKLTWSVAFVEGTITPTTTEGTGTTGRSCGSVTTSGVTATLADTTLSKPEDGCIYKLQVKNSGGIAAKLGTVTPTKPSSTTCGTASGANMVCGNITYKLTTDSAGSTVISSSNFTVGAGATKDLYLVVRYTGTSLASSAITQSGASFSLPFNQA